MHTVVYDHQIFSQQEYGGISRYFCEVASRIQRSPGFQARVIAPLHFNSHLAACAVPQTAVHWRKRIPKTGLLYRSVNALLAPMLTRAASPSLLHRTYYSAHLGRSATPTVLTVLDMIHELFPADFPAEDHVARDKRLGVAQADHIICISRCTATDLMRLYGVDASRISVTYLGHSEVFSRPAPAGEVSPHGRPYLLYVGQRAGYKNFDAALCAYANSPRLVREFDFVAFGGLAFSATERELVASLRLEPGRVLRWAGSDMDLARAYRHARVLVYPSKYEGFGIPPLEAMACGCAVVCSNASSIPEVVGEAAVLFDPNEVDSIRQALEELCLSDAKLADKVAAGTERVRHFSWDRCAHETVAAYRQVLNG